MNKSIEQILKLALETEEAIEKNAYIRSALLLIEESRPLCTTFPKKLSKDEQILREFRQLKKDKGWRTWHIDKEDEIRFAKEWYNTKSPTQFVATFEEQPHVQLDVSSK